MLGLVLPQKIEAQIVVVHDIDCNGSATGQLLVIPDFGTSPYTYLWSTGATTPDVNGLVAGFYDVTVTDVFAVINVYNVTLVDPPVLNIALTSQIDVLCNGAATGVIDITVGGGTFPYAYNWSNGALTEDITNIPAGSYEVLVTDANGCTANAFYTVTEPAALQVSVASTNVNCFGGSDGSAITTVIGGVGPYSFLWSTGAGTPGIINLIAGTYSVTVTDANGCVATAGTTVTQPSTPIQATPLQTNVSCFGGNDGAAAIVATGGTGALSYAWSTGAIIPLVSGLTAGPYDVTITDANGCTLVVPVIITEPLPFNVVLISQTDVLCNGENTGAIDISVVGGTFPYSYNWSNGAISEDIANIPAGSYDVIVTDANGCTAFGSYTITEPSAMMASITSTNVSCFGGNDGAATANVVGGVGPYTYAWSTGAGTPGIINLTAGSYSVTVTDANGCSATAGMTITQPSTPIGLSFFAFTDVSCFGGSDGTAAAIGPQGGTPPYSFLWSTGANTPSINNLTAGPYDVTITDANSCTLIIPVVITEPPLLTVALVSQTNVLCNGAWTGAIDVTVAGGIGPYSYLWERDGLLFAATEDLMNIPAGNYDLLVTDDNGCTATLNVAITETAASLQVSVVTSNVSCFGGNDGVAAALPIGGTGPYSYLWSTGDTTAVVSNLITGSYSVIVTDSNGCIAIATTFVNQPSFPIAITTTQTNVSCNGGNDGEITIVGVNGVNGSITFLWSTGDTSVSINNLSAGDYYVTVSDGNSCSAVDTLTITEPTPIIISVVGIMPSSCDGLNNGMVTINVTGGVGPYSYLWQGIDFDSIYTTQNLFFVRGGKYTLTVTDSTGCMAMDTITIPNVVTVPVDTTVTWYVCNGTTGSVYMHALNADSAMYFTYTWSSMFNNGSWTTNDSVFDHYESFHAGDILLTTTDLSTGCQNYIEFTIDQSATPMVVNSTHQDNLCYDDNSGIIQLNVTGGDPLPSYYVTWTGPSGFTSNAFWIGGLGTGTYTYTVTDDSACTVSGNIEIGPTLPLQGFVTATDIPCNGGSTGSAEAIFSGGTGWISYLWSTGDTTAAVSNLIAGMYTVTATDENGCTATGAVTVNQPGAIVITMDSANNVSCFGYTDGAIWTTVTGGSGTLTYTWLLDGVSFPQVTDDILNIPAGTYTLTVTDTNGCSATTIIVIFQPIETIFIDSVHAISCNNGADGYWSITPLGPYTPYIAIFSTGDTISTDTVPNPNISGLSAGSYLAVIYASNGCSWTFMQTFDQPLPISVALEGLVDVICKGDSSGSVTLDSPHGGTPPYTYLWSNGMTTNPIINVPAGVYSVTVTDALGCIIEDEYEVEEPYNFMKFFPTITTTSCQQAEDGQVVLWDWDVFDSPYINWLLLYDSTGNLVDSVGTGELIGNLPPGTYIGTLINSAGCWITDSIMIVDKGDEDCIIIPNLITPNGDGYNDVFRVEGGCEYEEFHVELFTDQGERVFESDDCAFTWDPIERRHALSNTVYFYYIRVAEMGRSYEFQSSLNINY